MEFVNAVHLVGTVAADPVTRTMPNGDVLFEIRLSIPEDGRRLLPLPVVIYNPMDLWMTEIAKGTIVGITGKMERRFYRSGAGARSLTEVVAETVRVVAPETVEEVS